MGAPCTEAVFGLIWKRHFQDHLAGMNLNKSQRPRAEHGRKGCEGSKTKLSAHPVWDDTVDIMLEDAVAYDPARPVADDPVPVCSNIIKSKRGVRGRP